MAKTKYANPPNQSKGILDDYAVRKAVATREGSVVKIPFDDIDIVNKKYIDNGGKPDHDYVEYTYDGNDRIETMTYKLDGVTVLFVEQEYNAQGDTSKITRTRGSTVDIENFAYTYNGFNQILTVTIT